MLNPKIQIVIDELGLPDTFLNTVLKWYKPLANNIAIQSRALGLPIVLGIQGAQGTGKSTCAEFLKLLFKYEQNLNSAVLSIDDFYLTREERQKLAKEVHPLLITRGVPGTHDLHLADQVITKLKNLEQGESQSIPRFDKATDDRFSERHWATVSDPVDIIILEGWCVGVTAQNENELTEPVNQLEKDEDPTGKWRHYVNKKLSNEYYHFFQQLNFLVTLVAPSFECVHEWRALQEQKLINKIKASSKHEHEQPKIRTLSKDELNRFIAHYERLTRYALKTLPKTARWVISLNTDHSISSLTENNA